MINKIYETKEILKQMNFHFNENDFIQLPNFLEKKPTLENLSFDKFEVLDFKKCSFLKFEKSNIDLKNIKTFFKSKLFYDFFEKITSSKINSIDIKFVKYDLEDFSIINDDFKTKNKYDIILDFTNSKSSNLIYLTKEEEVLVLEPAFNSLTIIKKYKNLLNYQKYLNCQMNQILRFEIQIN